MDLTAGYNADVARVYGVTEAMLLDTIAFWSRNSRRRDGFCWFTAKEFEANTAIKSGAMARAINNLIEQGVIEVKNTYIIGTQKKCRHFKIISIVESQAPEVEDTNCIEMEQSDCTETIQSESTETTQSVNSSNRALTELSVTKVTGETQVKYGKTEINELFDYWEENIGIKISSKVQYNRNACNNLIKKYGVNGVKQLIIAVQASHNDQFAPQISDFDELQSKLTRLLTWAKKKGTTSASARF